MWEPSWLRCCSCPPHSQGLSDMQSCLRPALAGLLLLAAGSCADQEEAPAASGVVDASPEGGEGCVAGEKVCLVVPKGAVDEAVEIGIRAVERKPGWAIDTAFRIEPEDLILQLPARVTYRIEPEAVSAVRGARWWLGLQLPSGEGEVLPGDPDGGAVTAYVRRFGVVAPMVDADEDGYPDVADLCPGTPDAEQQPCPPGSASGLGESCDPDCDGLDSVADTDDDGDGVEDGRDNCPLTDNAGQEPCPGSPPDAPGIACDPACDSVSDEGDADGDGVPDAADNCVGVANPDQEACASGSPLGRACDKDCNGLNEQVDPGPGPGDKDTVVTVTQEGEPLAGVAVLAYHAAGPLAGQQSVTDPRGKAFFPLFAGLPYRVDALYQQFAYTSGVFVAPADVRIAVPPFVGFSLRVTSGGDPAAGAPLTPAPPPTTIGPHPCSSPPRSRPRAASSSAPSSWRPPWACCRSCGWTRRSSPA